METKLIEARGQRHVLLKIRIDGKLEIAESLRANLVEASGAIFRRGIEPNRNRDRSDSNATCCYCQWLTIHVGRLILTVCRLTPALPFASL